MFGRSLSTSIRHRACDLFCGSFPFSSCMHFLYCIIYHLTLSHDQFWINSIKTTINPSWKALIHLRAAAFTYSEAPFKRTSVTDISFLRLALVSVVLCCSGWVSPFNLFCTPPSYIFMKTILLIEPLTVDIFKLYRDYCLLCLEAKIYIYFTKNAILLIIIILLVKSLAKVRKFYIEFPIKKLEYVLQK